MRYALLLLVLSFVSGCYFTRSPSRPIPALEFRRQADMREQCLVIFIPGFLDGPDSYREHEFPNDLLDSGSYCDSVAIDLHYRYYGTPNLGEMVYEDIIAPAQARGYQDIWLVGISMGGLGTLLTAEENRDAIDGIILLAPFLGDEALLREISEAGGPAAWHPPADIENQPRTEANFSHHLWAWLRRYETDPESMPPLFIGWGESDRLGPGARLLADMLEEHHVFTQPGQHNWATWRPIFNHLLREARPGR